MSLRWFVVVLTASLLSIGVSGCLQQVPEIANPGLDEAQPESVGSSSFVGASPFGSNQARGNVSVHFLDVGQGDGIVVEFPSSVVVVDAGPWTGSEEEAVRDWLQANGVSEVRLFVVTHPDADHAGGCDEVLGYADVSFVVHPGVSKDTETWTECRSAIRAEGAGVFTASRLHGGHHLNVSQQGLVEVWHVGGSGGSVNEASVVLFVEWGQVGFALTGDIGCGTEEALVASGLLREAEVLKVAHHGSAGSSCDAFLDRVDPEVGVVSVGAENRYGHPAPEALERLRSHSVDVFRTDQSGVVTVRSNGSGYEVRTQTGGSMSGTGSEGTQGSGSNASVVISEVHPDAEGNDNENLNGEWVDVKNAGNASVDLSGFTLRDEADHVYAFSDGFVLGPDAVVRVHTGAGSDSASDVYWGREGAVWNNGQDTATLRDQAGAVVDAVAW